MELCIEKYFHVVFEGLNVATKHKQERGLVYWIVCYTPLLRAVSPCLQFLAARSATDIATLRPLESLDGASSFFAVPFILSRHVPSLNSSWTQRNLIKNGTNENIVFQVRSEISPFPREWRGVRRWRDGSVANTLTRTDVLVFVTECVPPFELIDCIVVCWVAAPIKRVGPARLTPLLLHTLLSTGHRLFGVLFVTNWRKMYA